MNAHAHARMNVHTRACTLTHTRAHARMHYANTTHMRANERVFSMLITHNGFRCLYKKAKYFCTRNEYK